MPSIFLAMAAQVCAGLVLWYLLRADATSTLLLSAPLPLAWLQGALAAMLSFALGQRSWWLAIQFLFWPCILVARTFELPGEVYLGAFVCLLLLYWNTYRTQAPLFLSGRDVWRAVESLLPVQREFKLIDIGCGFGGVLHYLSAVRAYGVYTGVELAPLPYAVARVRSLASGRRYRVLRRDYQRINLGQFDFVFCFLSPAAMPALWQQAHAQMHKGSVLVSCEFPVPGQRAASEVAVAGASGRSLYVYRMR